MTLCIGALARREQKIVLAADLMLSNDIWSTETLTSKIEAISMTRQWFGLFAGDPDVWFKVLRHLGKSLTGSEETLEKVNAELSAALDNALCSRIEGELLSPFGISRERFLLRGRAHFGEVEFSRLLARIQTVRLNTDVMVAGFEPQGAMRLICGTRPGETIDHESLGFYAIGSGSYLALSSLYATYDDARSLSDVIYRVCEAKFAGERAPGVGRRTVVMVMSRDGKHEWIHPDRMGAIRELCDRARPPVPPTAAGVIREQLGPMEWRVVGGDEPS